MSEDVPSTEQSHDAERAQPETMRLRSVAPLLTVNDVAASAAWYADVLGFHQAGEWRGDDGALRGVRMTAGDVDFTLLQDDFEKGRDRPKGVGFRLYCITVQDVDDWARRIVEQGGTLDMEPTTMQWGVVFPAGSEPVASTTSSAPISKRSAASMRP